MNTLLQKTLPFFIAFLITLSISYILDKKIKYTEKINSKFNFNEGYIPCFYIACASILIATVAIIRNGLLGFSVPLLYVTVGLITALLTNALIHSN